MKIADINSEVSVFDFDLVLKVIILYLGCIGLFLIGYAMMNKSGKF
jgi:hypothetical protein